MEQNKRDVYKRQVTVDTLRGVDDDFLNKLVAHGCSQLGEVRVLPCQLQKLLHTGGVLRKSGQDVYKRQLLNIAALAVLILFGCHNPSLLDRKSVV